jgi:signal peptidase I
MSNQTIGEIDEESVEARRRPLSRYQPLDWALLFLMAAAVAILLHTFVLQTFYIPSGSMEPNLNIGDHIVVSKLSTELGSVHIGEVLVFHTPPGEHQICGGRAVPYLVKRVVGLPGDQISSQGNTIYVNGVALEQTWAHSTALGTQIGSVVVPRGHYFMLGDNQTTSCDSRYWGPLSANLVVGEAVMTFWPLSHLGFL